MKIKNIREILRKKKVEIRLKRTILKEKIKNRFYQFVNANKIKEYVKYKNNRKARGVIYTCITGGYDNLKTHKYIDLDWDYVCFTDEKNMKTDKVWDIRPLVFDKMDISRNNRWHKMHPHLLFPEYERSLYIDGNIRILSKKFFRNLETKKESLFISTLHPKRNCLYKEAQICSEAKMEKKEIIDKQIEIIKGGKFPTEYGLYEANIIYRQHNNEKIKKMCEEWWWFVKNLAKRDQLSLTYVCWKNNIPFITFLNKSYRKKNNEIKVTPHLKNR